MQTNQTKTLEKFYASFSKGNAEAMNSCYHENATFEDPAFGKLNSNQVKAMWQMLLSKKEESQFKIKYQVLSENSATWEASYLYGKRKVVNNVSSTFIFKEDKIIRHIDDFNLWKWTQQALGLSGYLLGWSSFMRNKIQKTTNQKLKKFMNS